MVREHCQDLVGLLERHGPWIVLLNVFRILNSRIDHSSSFSRKHNLLRLERSSSDLAGSVSNISRGIPHTEKRLLSNILSEGRLLLRLWVLSHLYLFRQLTDCYINLFSTFSFYICFVVFWFSWISFYTLDEQITHKNIDSKASLTPSFKQPIRKINSGKNNILPMKRRITYLSFNFWSKFLLWSLLSNWHSWSVFDSGLRPPLYYYVL